jgi:predicted dithiol-disulfide oxidoreductase (DUF899 family)
MARCQQTDQGVGDTVVQGAARARQCDSQFDDLGVTRHLRSILVSAVGGFWLSRPAGCVVNVIGMVRSQNRTRPAAGATGAPGLPLPVDRATFQAELDALRVREKAQAREGDAIATARRQLPIVEVDASLPLTGPGGPLTLLEAFEGRRQLIACYFMRHPGHPAAEQREGCTFCTSQVSELSHLHSRDITYAVLCQGPYEESIHYHDFMGWQVPWYSAEDSLASLLAPLMRPGRMHVVCCLRHGDRVFETYWGTLRGVETMDYSSALMDLTVYGRQEPWGDSPPGWPRQCSCIRTDGGEPGWPPVAVWPGGRPIAQWPRLAAGRSDDTGTGKDGP